MDGPSRAALPAMATAAPARMIGLVALDGASIPRLLHDTLDAAGLKVRPLSASDLTSGAAAGEPVIAVANAPVTGLAMRLVAGASLPDAVAAWKTDTETALAALRPVRRRLALLDRAALSGQPKHVIRHLGERLNMDLPEPAQPDAACAQPGPDSVLIANLVFCIDAAALDMAEEFRALMIGPVQDLADDLSEVASTWSACQQRTANLEEEIELVRESMQSLVEAIEDEARARRIVILEQEATARAREADSDRAAQREAVLGRALQEAGRRTDAAETELRNIYGSRSWRVAKTLRTIRRPL
jgi:hypothetical protein